MSEPELPEGLEGLNHPFDEVTQNAERLSKRGAWVFQKFTCDGCGNRLTIDQKNVFYTRGACDQCGHVTDLRETGCNFLLVWPLVPTGKEATLEIEEAGG